MPFSSYEVAWHAMCTATLGDATLTGGGLTTTLGGGDSEGCF